MSLSSVPTLLPPISFFLISIRMTILGRNVYPPPCHPAPPSHTTHHVHHRPEIKITFWISRCQAADSKVTKNYWKRSLSPISTSPFSKTNLPSPIFSNGYLGPATCPKTKTQTTVCITMSSSMQHEYRRSKCVRIASQPGCMHLILVPSPDVNATCPVCHTDYCEDWYSKMRLNDPLQECKHKMAYQFCLFLQSCH